MCTASMCRCRRHLCRGDVASCSEIADAPRYASVLPPPVGKKMRSTSVRLGCVGRTSSGRLARTNADLETHANVRTLVGSRIRMRSRAAPVDVVSPVDDAPDRQPRPELLVEHRTCSRAGMRRAASASDRTSCQPSSIRCERPASHMSMCRIAAAWYRPEDRELWHPTVPRSTADTAPAPFRPACGPLRSLATVQPC